MDWSNGWRPVLPNQRAARRRGRGIRAFEKRQTDVVLWLLLAIALFFTWLFFHDQRQRHDEFQSRRQRYRERRQHAALDQPIDPNFQFDQSPPQGPIQESERIEP